ncbi:MAG: hypothetical protein ACRD1N_06455 [Terriglobia bacterium]
MRAGSTPEGAGKMPALRLAPRAAGSSTLWYTSKPGLERSVSVSIGLVE